MINTLYPTRLPSLVRNLSVRSPNSSTEAQGKLFETAIQKFSYYLPDFEHHTILEADFSKTVRYILIKFGTRGKYIIPHAMTEFREKSSYRIFKLIEWSSGEAIRNHNSKILLLITRFRISDDFGSRFLKNCKIHFDKIWYTW